MNRKHFTLCLAAILSVLPLAAHAQDAGKTIHGYSITFNLITTDSGKRIGSESYTMTVDTTTANVQDGRPYTGRGVIKVGEKVPVATGTFNGEHGAGTQTQFTYLDIGINIEATLTETPTGLLLASKVEQSSLAPQPSVIAGVSEPVIRQVVLNNSSSITLYKEVTIGALHMPESQRRIDVEVDVKPLP